MLHLTQEMSFTTLAGTNGDIPLRRHEGQELVAILINIYCLIMTTFCFGTEHLMRTSLLPLSSYVSEDRKA